MASTPYIEAPGGDRVELFPGMLDPPSAGYCAVLPCVRLERDHYWGATSMAYFFFQIVATLPLLLVGIILIFWTELNWQLRTQESVIRRVFFSKCCKPARE